MEFRIYTLLRLASFAQYYIFEAIMNKAAMEHSCTSLLYACFHFSCKYIEVKLPVYRVSVWEKLGEGDTVKPEEEADNSILTLC